MRKLVRLRITGRVQGVGYRAFVEAQAERLKLEGWVRNRRDGTVEAVVFGSSESVETLFRACREGRSASRVTAIDATGASEAELSQKPSHEKFAVLPTV